MSTRKRVVEIFSAGCPCCTNFVAEIKKKIGPEFDVYVLDVRVSLVARRAKDLGVSAVPAVTIDGKLAAGSGRGPDMEKLRTELGITQA
jgi:glutaredoxin 3